MLAGRGFDHIYNLSGGIKAWKGEVARGGEEVGLELFSGDESLEHVLRVAYALEEGLRELYLSLTGKVDNREVVRLFRKLAEIEVKHQERILEYWNRHQGTTVTREQFKGADLEKTIEGGLTTDEFAALYRPDWNSVTEVVAVAMSVEAQALDLYQRASRKSRDGDSTTFLLQIASEEKTHLKMLGSLIDQQ